MAKYLVHAKADGTPVGLFTESAHYYPAQNKNFEAYGTSLVSARRSGWDDFVDAMSNRVPGRFDRWYRFSSPATTIADAYQDAVERLSPPR